jgi:iron complex outermembrane receptor protein
LAENREVAINTDASFYRQQSQLHGVKLIWGLAPLDLESITAYSRQYDLGKQEDVDGSDFSLVPNGERLALRTLDAAGIEHDQEERYQISQELKFNGRFLDDKLDLTFGTFYSAERIDCFAYPQIIGANGVLGIPPSFLLASTAGISLPSADLVAAAANTLVLPLLAASVNLSFIENDTRAVFIQGSYNLSRDLQLTLGIRYTEDDKQREVVLYNADFDAFGQREGLILAQGGIYNPVPRPVFDNINFALPIPFLAPVSTEAERSFDQLSPAFTLSYDWGSHGIDSVSVDSLMTYLTISEGYKSGGLGLRGRRLNEFEPGTVENSEIGFKLEALSSRLRLNGAIYRMDYDHIQVQQAETGPKKHKVRRAITASKCRIAGIDLWSCYKRMRSQSVVLFRRRG